MAYQRICSDPRSLHSAKEMRPPPYPLHEVREIVVREEIYRIHVRVIGPMEAAGLTSDPDECVAWLIRRLLWETSLRNCQTRDKEVSRKPLNWRSHLFKLKTWRTTEPAAIVEGAFMSLRNLARLSRRGRLAWLASAKQIDGQSDQRRL